MTEKCIGWMYQQKALLPDKTFFVYFVPGATRTPCPRNGRTVIYLFGGYAKKTSIHS
jgi:hypothetical protein